MKKYFLLYIITLLSTTLFGQQTTDIVDDFMSKDER